MKGNIYGTDKRARFAGRSLAWGLILAICLGVTGCSLARPEGETTAAGAEKDTLVGLFITTEHIDLFDMEAWLNDNADRLLDGGEIAVSDRAEYTDRLFAERVADAEGREWVVRFPGYEGWYYLENPANILLDADEERTEPQWTAPNDIHSLGVNITSTDALDEIHYSGVFYFALNTAPRPQTTPEPESIQMEDGSVLTRLPDDWVDSGTFYINPVYETADGRLYTFGGNGVSLSGTESEGESYGMTLRESDTVTRNGVSRTETTAFELKFYGVWPTTLYRFLQLDADGNRLRLDEFAPDALPDALEILPGTDCLLVERHYTSRDDPEQVERTAFDRSGGFVDGSRKMGDLIYSYGQDRDGETQAVLCMPVPGEDADTFDFHEMALVIQK